MDVIGLGSTGLVIRRGSKAVKIPKEHRGDDEYYLLISREGIRHESKICEHLRHVDGVVAYGRISESEIEMPFFPLGDLAEYLQQHPGITTRQRLQWVRTCAATICRVHAKRVLISDVAARNFLVDDDLELKLADFDNSEIIPVDEDMSTERTSGACLKLDVAHFGSLLFEVITGCPGPGSESREKEECPNTEGVVLGDIIRKCWAKNGGYQNMDDVCEALDSEINRLQSRYWIDGIFVLFPLALALVMSTFSRFRRRY